MTDSLPNLRQDGSYQLSPTNIKPQPLPTMGEPDSFSFSTAPQPITLPYAIVSRERINMSACSVSPTSWFVSSPYGTLPPVADTAANAYGLPSSGSLCPQEPVSDGGSGLPWGFSATAGNEVSPDRLETSWYSSQDFCRSP